MTGKRAEPVWWAAGRLRPDSVLQTELIEAMALLAASLYPAAVSQRLTALVLILKVAESAVVARAPRSGLPEACPTR